MKITENTIVITGGGSGIGRGLAEAFHQRGNRVIIAGRRKELLDKVAAANPGMKAMALDIQSQASINDFAKRLAGDFPQANVLINNSGIMRMENLAGGAPDVSAAAAMVVTNILGPIWLTAAVLPQLRKQARSAVMMVTSGLAFVPLAVAPTYCATKAAIHSYTESLRYQLKDSTTEVLELIPPYVQTELGGDHQTRDPRAMPLDQYIKEVMQILETQPGTHEICVERAKGLRIASESGKYDAVFQGLNSMVFKPE